ncbi:MULTISPECIES: hypothetical protein [Paraburkholderia]|uniref:hypothetical protein n=1 Tax=Paraburkholderia TaxID=1822464 RepID=UPI00224FAA41|nr:MULTISPECIES: hypothetical protein [Paraburkholderia]MCX4154967.1 hypothetical protein [Paraburkholderia aspalathi]MDN7164378.1 helix-turn-helix domain-containing protein [Paraburkholderia sp. SECH2]MDQ6392863.1 helix-turn-helix domain-containing protein [Paraburkholderia aspalathi]
MDKNRDPFAIAVIKALDGTAATARLFGIEPPSVSNWKKTGIPPARLMYLEVARPEVLAQVRAELRKEKEIPAVAAADDVQPPVGSPEDPKK